MRRLQSCLLARGVVLLFLTCAASIQQWGGFGGGGGSSFVHGLSSKSVDDSLSLTTATTTTTSVFDLPPREQLFSKHHPLLFNKEYHDVKILTNFCGYSIANGLKEYFSYLGVAATVVETIDQGDVARNVLYIALFAFLYDFPPGLKYIAYQLEQKQQSAWFNDKYRKNLAESAYVFDYSVQNYQYMEFALQKKTIYLPVPLPLAKTTMTRMTTTMTKTMTTTTMTTSTTSPAVFSSSSDDKQQEEGDTLFEHDVLFYGSLCERRSRVLDELQSKHNVRIKVVTGVYGESMAEIIKKSRVVLNLHFYENALLETTRINEVLQHDRIVVSEDPAAEDKYSRALYEDSVIFTKNLDEYTTDDGRHIAELATTLRFYSDPANYERYVAKRRPALAALKRHCFGRFVKALISIRAFPPTRFYERLGSQMYSSSPENDENTSFGTAMKTTTTKTVAKTTEMATVTTSTSRTKPPKTIYYLSLDEAWQTRRELFLRQPHLPADLKQIAAVKAWPGLLGSGMSYKFALNSAKLSGLAQITLCEDDVEFPPTFERDYEIVLEYLSTLEKWDVFVGLIANVDDSTRVFNVEKYKGVEFVEIDKVSSTVFTIYSASSYDRILAWGDDDGDGGGKGDARAANSISVSTTGNADFDNASTGKSISNNPTKAFYSPKRKPTIITTNPPIVKHMELGSTSWDKGREYPPWFATPAGAFARKVEEFKEIEKTNREAPNSLLCKGGGASCHRRQRRRHRPYRARKGLIANVGDGNGGDGNGGGGGGTANAATST